MHSTMYYRNLMYFLNRVDDPRFKVWKHIYIYIYIYTYIYIYIYIQKHKEPAAGETAQQHGMRIPCQISCGSRSKYASGDAHLDRSMQVVMQQNSQHLVENQKQVFSRLINRLTCNRAPSPKQTKLLIKCINISKCGQT
jgi:hypothetical protein